MNDNFILGKRNLPVNSKFLFVGRYERRKGIEELMKIVSSLPEIEISFVGSIPRSKKIKRDNVKYFGEVKDVLELNKIYDEHTFIVCPSHSEGLPNVLLEGMSRGLIPIATRVGAVEELVKEKYGFLIDSKKEIELKATLEKANSLDISAKENLSKHAIATIQNHFSWTQIANRTIENFQQVIEKH